MTIATQERVVDAEIVRTDDEWAEIIRAEMARTAESIVLTGQYLIAAKADVAHGAWLPMLRKIGISDGYARKMMSIAGSGGISNRLSSNDLPSSVDALYQLSRLAPEAIESGIESGDVHPGMTIRDAKGYAQEVTERDTPANVNTETGEIAAPSAPTNDTEKEVAIVNDLRLYLSHIGTDKTIRNLTPTAKQHIIAALEAAATNLKESL